MPDTLEDLTRLFVAFRAERDWQQFHNPKDQFLSLALEAAEVLELAQWRNGDDLDRHLADNADAVADELSDVLGWVLLIAHDRGIDLPSAFRRKMAKNAAKYPVERSRGRATKYDAYDPPADPTSDRSADPA